MKFSASLTAVIVGVSALLGGCQSTRPPAGTVGNATDDSAPATSSASTLERCVVPLGTVAVIENPSAPWYGVLRHQLQLPPTAVFLRSLMQESNCFVPVEGQGAANYTLSPDLGFIVNPTGLGLSLGGLLGGRYGGLLASVGSTFQTREVSAILTLADARTGAPVVTSQGSGSRWELSGFGGMSNGSTGGLDSYRNTAQGKVVAGALTEAFNRMVRMVPANARAASSVQPLR